MRVFHEPDEKAGDVVQLVRTLPCHGRGREFESRRPRQLFQQLYRKQAAISPQQSRNPPSGSHDQVGQALLRLGLGLIQV
jgi:hypothetical protein